MKHVVAAIDRIAPAGILRQVGGEERKRLSRRRAALAQHREHVAVPVRMAHGGPHVVAGGQQLQDGMHPDKTRPARNQNRCSLPNFLSIMRPRCDSGAASAQFGICQRFGNCRRSVEVIVACTATPRGGRSIRSRLAHSPVRALLVAIDLLAPLVALLRLDRQGRDRAGFEPLQGDRLAGLLAIAVGAVLDALQRGIDLGDQFALAVAGAQLDRAVGFGGGAVGEVGVVVVLLLQGLQGVFGFPEDLVLPGQQLGRKYSRCRSFMKGSFSEGR